MMAANLEHRAGSYDPDPAGYAEPANTNATRSSGTHDLPPVTHGESVGTNSPSSPVLELRSTGSGVALARTLVRVLVRRALIQEGIVLAPEDCAKQAKPR